jgi:hypothetical protein
MRHSQNIPCSTSAETEGNQYATKCMSNQLLTLHSTLQKACCTSTFITLACYDRASPTAVLCSAYSEGLLYRNSHYSVKRGTSNPGEIRKCTAEGLLNRQRPSCTTQAGEPMLRSSNCTKEHRLYCQDFPMIYNTVPAKLACPGNH